MATRLYMTSVAPSYTPGVWRYGWAANTTSGAPTYKLGLTKAGINAARTANDSSAVNNYKAPIVRFVSDPLLSAGAFDAALTFTWARMESNAAANMFLQYHIWITAGNTDTMRGQVSSLTGATEFPTTLTNQSFTDTDTPVEVQVGDRIVVELGFSAANTVSTTYTATTRVGGTAGDLATTGTTGATTNSPWIEFANNDARFLPPPPTGPTYAVLLPNGTQAPATLSGVLMPDGTLKPITTTVQQ